MAETPMFSRIKDYLVEGWFDFATWVEENRQKALALVFGTLVTGCLLSFLMVYCQSRIRQSELADQVYPTVTTPKLIPFDYGEGDQRIKETKAISVMFSTPKAQDYGTVVELLDPQKKGAELNRNLYYYPIVYDQGEVAEKYRLDPNQVTFIFFEKGKEKNRFTMAELKNVEQEFLPELNRLPMWSIKDLEQ